MIRKRKPIPNPPSPPSKLEIWNSLEGGEITLNKDKYNLTNSNSVREFIYEIGIQPDAYMFKKGLVSGTVTIRFKNSEDLAFFQLSI